MEMRKQVQEGVQDKRTEKSNQDDRTGFLVNLREKNLAALEKPQTPSLVVKLDVSMKKNLSFVKKVKQITVENIESLLNELEKLKVDKYLAEITTSILENFTASNRKLSSADVDALLTLCSHLHQRYTAHFTPSLVEQMIAACNFKSFGDIHEREERERLSRSRSIMRFLTDCYLVGLFLPMSDDSTGLFASTSEATLRKDGRNVSVESRSIADRTFANLFKPLFADKSLSNIPILAAVARFHGPLILSNDAAPNDGYSQLGVPFQLQHQLRVGYHQCFANLCAQLKRHHREMMKLHAKDREWYYEKGYEAPDDVKQRLEKAQATVEALTNQAQLLSTQLQLPMPSLETETEISTAASGTHITLHKAQRGSDYDRIWQDDEQKAFYTRLPELELYLPPSLIDPATLASEASTTNSKLEQDRTAGNGEAALEDDDRDENIELSGATIKEDDGPEIELEQGSSEDAKLAMLLDRIPHCDSKDMIDAAAIEFCHFNTRKARRLLARTLLDVRMRVDMVGYYARLLAVLKRFPIANLVVSEVEHTFRRQIRSKKGSLGGRGSLEALESKLVTARYMAELVKFGLVPDHAICYCIKLLLDFFNAQNAEALCHLLEGCGLYLLLSNTSSSHIADLLDRLNKQKKLLTDQRLVLMVESAQLACSSNTRSFLRTQKERSKQEEYLLHLLSDLSKDTVKQVVTQIRKFQWSDPQTMIMMTKRFAKLKGIRMDQLEPVAATLSQLSVHQPDLAIHVVDTLVEGIKHGMERGNYQDNQKRLLNAAYIGHLFNIRLVDSVLIFDILHLLVTSPSHSNSQSFFRIRLVCQLLHVCGKRLQTAKLDAFLTIFQLFVVSKDHVPIDVEFVYLDIMESLRPDSKCLNREEAVAAVRQLLSQQNKCAAASEEVDYVNEAVEATSSEALNSGDAIPEGGTLTDESNLSSCSEDDQESSDSELDEYDSDAASDEVDESVEQDRKRRNEEEDALADLDRELQLLMLGTNTSEARRRGQQAKSALEIPEDLLRNRSSAWVPGTASTYARGSTLALLSKRGNKAFARDIVVTEESELGQHAASIRAREEAERLELKKLVLKYERREQEEQQVRKGPGKTVLFRMGLH